LCQLLDELHSFLPEVSKVIKVRGRNPAKRKRYQNPLKKEPTNSNIDQESTEQEEISEESGE
jgi:hypothetical protein